MNSTEIAKRLAKVTEYEQGMDLLRACDTRREEINSRLALILPRPEGSALGQTPLRQQAAIEGLEAIIRLDNEVRELHAEQTHLGTLSTLCHDAAARCREAAIREVAPKAIKAVPQRIARVREALRALDVELDALNRESTAINEAQQFADFKFPFNDRECVELLQLREDLWTTRNVVCVVPIGPTPGAPGAYPLSMQLAYKWHDTHTWGNRVGPNWPASERRHPGPQKQELELAD